MSELLPYIALDSGKNPRYAIIWLHGLGADGHDFVPMVNELKIPVAVRYIFPHANKIPVTVNGGYVMRAWYDISSNRIASEQDELGIRRSAEQISALIAQQIASGIPAKRIFLAGFSQGGAIALHVALRSRFTLAGVLALSTYLPLHQTAAIEISAAAKNCEIFMAHGKHDQIVPYALGETSAARLSTLGCPLQWHEYAMEHSVCQAEISDIAKWLGEKIATQA
ncbi:MAG: alpha/beta hydrolase fold domain-containing protein [Sideroxydans sp.]|nr:alpha/beta hydrolase fold domain-containing protein [Sideroxydans sp.]